MTTPPDAFLSRLDKKIEEVEERLRTLKSFRALVALDPSLYKSLFDGLAPFAPLAPLDEPSTSKIDLENPDPLPRRKKREGVKIEDADLVPIPDGLLPRADGTRKGKKGRAYFERAVAYFVKTGNEYADLDEIAYGTRLTRDRIVPGVYRGAKGYFDKYGGGPGRGRKVYFRLRPEVYEEVLRTLPTEKILAYNAGLGAGTSP